MQTSRDPTSRISDPAGFVRSFAQAAPDAIVISDHQGIIQLWNPGAERLFGYSEEEAVGRPVSMIVPERLRTSKVIAMVRRRTSSSRSPSKNSWTLSPPSISTGP